MVNDADGGHATRKRQHLEICLTQDVRSGLTTGLERLGLVHQALPELALDDVRLGTRFLGRNLQAPLLISAMTGGTEAARRVNLRLAAAAQEIGVAMGLGSQRALVEDCALLPTYDVRSVAPDILLLANLGAVQLNYGYGAQECQRAVESIGADALVLHLNPLQEALQDGGNTDFRGVCSKIADLIDHLSCPVVVKEVGWGLSARVAAQLRDAGVAGLDLGGAGGTSWSEVERLRSTSPTDASVADAFAQWGIPTAESLRQVRAECPELPVIASGGITDGVGVAKCLALGADLVGMAHVLLQPASDSTEAVVNALGVVLRQLRIAMFCTGVSYVRDLDNSHLFQLW